MQKSLAKKPAPARMNVGIEAFLGDEETEAIVIIGEIGGTAEEETAQFVKNSKIKTYLTLTENIIRFLMV